jgi:hypothetical protein
MKAPVQDLRDSNRDVLQVKCLRVLQYFPPPEDPEALKTLTEVLKKIITGNEVVKNINKNNAQHSIVFEVRFRCFIFVSRC